MEATGAGGEAAPLPTGVVLTEIEQRALSYAAAMGKEFRFDVLALVTEMGEEPLAEVLEGLVHRGVLREFAGGDVYAFVREETQSQAYRTISSSRLRVIHRKIAEAYEKNYATDPPQEAIAEMGRHFHLGKVPEQSVMYNRYAATLARGSFSPETALAYLGRVVDDLESMPGEHAKEEVDLYRELGDVHLSMGEAAKADEAYLRSLAKIPESDATVRALLLLSRAEACRVMDKIPATHALCVEAIALLEKANHRRGLALAHRTLSRAYFKEANYEAGKKEIERALELLNPKDDAREIARSYIDLGNAFTNGYDPSSMEQAVSAYKRAIEELTKLRDYRELARAHTNLAVAVGTSDPAWALRELKLGREAAQKVKDRRSYAWSLFNSVEFSIQVGEVAQAEEFNEKAGELLGKMDDPMGIQQVVLNRGILAEHRQNYAQAETLYLDALHRAEGLSYITLVAEMHLRLAQLYLLMGQGPRARERFATVESMGGEKVVPYVRPMYQRIKKQLGNLTN